MKRTILIVLLVFVLSIAIFGVASAKGWQDNPEAWYWLIGGKYLFIKQEAEMLWRDAYVNFSWLQYTGDMVWLRDHTRSCPDKFPVTLFSTFGADFTPFLGWNDPLWQDGFKACGSE